MGAMTKAATSAKAKPFIKWVGGKSQLIGQLSALLPADFGRWKDATYVEPFVGGGAMLFSMLQTYPNITRAAINDINKDLMTCYEVVRDKPMSLVKALQEIQDEYFALEGDARRKAFYLDIRARYNTKTLDDIENSTLFIFLNRTCFNGLYRENKSGLFNVPFGKYANPTICDRDTIMADSALLQHVELLNGDFEQTFDYANGQTLFYFDPPYRPLSSTSNFNDYVKEKFNDESQQRLKSFCDKVDVAGFHFMLSNSDCPDFFDNLYADYVIERVLASRSVNSNAAKRGKLTEILVRNYQ